MCWGCTVLRLTSLASTRKRSFWPCVNPSSLSQMLPPVNATRAKFQAVSIWSTAPVIKVAASSPWAKVVFRSVNTCCSSPLCCTLPCASTTTWLASLTSSSIECVTYSIGILSASRRCSSHGKMSCRRDGSNDDKGSSSSSKRGCVAKARAMATRWRSPPDRLAMGRSIKWLMPSNSMACSKACGPPGLWQRFKP